MLRNRSFRLIVAGGALAGGMLGGAALGLSATAGAAGGPATSAKPDIVAGSVASLATGAQTKVLWKNLALIPGYTSGKGAIAITECNPAVLAMDQFACNQNPLTLGQPGGPYLATGNANGTGGDAKVFVVAADPFNPFGVQTGAVGDGGPGSCVVGALCYISVSSSNPLSPVEYGLVPIGFNPAA